MSEGDRNIEHYPVADEDEARAARASGLRVVWHHSLDSGRLEPFVPFTAYRGAVEALRDLADAARRDRMGSPLPYEEWRLRYDAALTITGGQ